MSSTSRALQVDYRYSNYNTTTAAAVATVASIIVIFFFLRAISFLSFLSHFLVIFHFILLFVIFLILTISLQFILLFLLLFPLPFFTNPPSHPSIFSLFLPSIITTNIIILALYPLLIRFCLLTVLIPILR